MKWKKCICIGLVLLLLVSVVYNPESQGQAKSKLKLNKTNLELNTGESFTLKLNDKKINKKVKWSSKNKKVATVSSKGRVIGVNKGKTVIYGKYKEKKYNCKIKVREIKKDNNTNIQINTVNTPDNQISQVQSTTVPTVIPTLQPTAQPTATPIPTPTLDPYLALRDYVLTSDKVDDDGNHYYSKTSNTDKSEVLSKLSYDNSNNCFTCYFVQRMKTTALAAFMKIDMNSENDNIIYYFKHICLDNTSRLIGLDDVEKSCEINKKQIKQDNKFEFFTNESNDKEIIEYYNNQANGCLDILLNYFYIEITVCNLARILSNLNGEYALADFGFTNYEVKSSK